MPADKSRGPSAVGTRLGAYELTGFIAEGGMGTVYAARSRVTGEPRAIKVLRAELAAEPELISRFVKELRIAAAVEHPNLVKVYEPGMEGDTFFLPMELLEGETLAQRLSRAGPMPEPEAIALVRAVGSAVLAVHQQGILHRDLKPSNIFLVRGESGVSPKVLDLGAAKDIDATEDATKTGMVIGSPHFMSFEQASGAKDLDARTDQYSLAVMLYQVLTGARPYDGDGGGNALSKLLAGVPFPAPRVLVPTISPITEEVILRGIQRHRDERYPTLRDFLAALPEAVDEVTRIAPAQAGVQTPRATPPVSRSPEAAPKASSLASTGRGARTAVMARPSTVPAAALGVVAAVVVVFLGLTALRSLRPTLPKPADKQDFGSDPRVASTASATAPPAPLPAPSPASRPLPAPVSDPVATAPHTAEAPKTEAPPSPSPVAVSAPATAPATARAAAGPAAASPPSVSSKPRPPTRPSGPPPCQPTPAMPCL